MKPFHEITAHSEHLFPPGKKIRRWVTYFPDSGALPFTGKETYSVDLQLFAALLSLDGK